LAHDLELIEKSKWNTIFRLDIPVGNFELPLMMPLYAHDAPFSVGPAKTALPFTVQPKFSDFFVNA